jgi:hypothetical protein
MLPVIFYNLAQHLIASIVDLTAVQKLASNAAARGPQWTRDR